MKKLFCKYALLIALLSIVTGCNDQQQKELEPVEMSGWTRCEGGICLVYIYSQLDTDGDGVSDKDEITMGTDPKDSESHPSTLKITEEIGKGRVESFNMGYSELVILPTKSPDGKELNFGSTVLSGYKSDALGRLGISESTIAAYGLNFSTGFTLLTALPSLGKPAGSRDQDAPRYMKVGGIVVGLISQDESWDSIMPGKTGYGRPKGYDNPAPSTSPNTSTTPGTTPNPEPRPVETTPTTPPPTEKPWYTRLWESIFGAPDKKPDAGTTGLTTGDPDVYDVAFITPEDFDRAWYKIKGGDVSRTVNPGGPEIIGDPPVLGSDPNGPIMLTQETEKKMKNMILVFPLLPSPKNTKEQNTNYGPKLIDGIITGSGTPPHEPGTPPEPPH